MVDSSKCSSSSFAPLVLTSQRQYDYMSELRHRKLIAMGIASLVSTGKDEVLECLPIEIFGLWLHVFREIREAAKDWEATSEEYVPQCVTLGRC